MQVNENTVITINTEIAVLGAGPAGLAAAMSAKNNGAHVILIERENRLGGILKQCIHDGFGLVRYNEKLTGPEYALRDIKTIKSLNVPAFVNTFVLEVEKKENSFVLYCINEKGAYQIEAQALILATGCRERTDRQIFLHGERPAGIYTAGLAQHFVNIDGYLPGKEIVIIGSGDIGLIMARRLTLEGAHIVGVYEVKPEPSGLQRNIAQCLNDFSIPLHLSCTVKTVHGKNRIEGVTVVNVDESGKEIKGSEKYITCDCLILSVGLIPENEIAQSLNVSIDPDTKGPYVDQNMHTLVDGIFACGNSVHVHDLVDYVSESGTIAGESAVRWIRNKRKRNLIKFSHDNSVLYHIPQFVDFKSNNKIALYFRSKKTYSNTCSVNLIEKNSKTCLKKFKILRPSEMEKIVFDAQLQDNQNLMLQIEENYGNY